MGLMRGAPQLKAALDRFVDELGRVDYAAMLADGSAYASARELEAFDLSTLRTREAKLAFWINAYNGLVLVGVLDGLKNRTHYRGVKEGGLPGLLRFFYIRRYLVGGRLLSLATIENRFLRKELREPRIHFALVCASTSCPPLRRGLYSAANIDAELDAAASRFIHSPKNMLIERETHSVWLSMIFKWYRKDFAGTRPPVASVALQDAGAVLPGSALNFIKPYLSTDDLAYLDRHEAQVRLRYFKYDWHLNDRD